MEQRKWTQLDLSISSGVNPATLSRFFREKYDLDVGQLSRVAAALGAKPGDLLERSEVDDRVVQLQPILDEIEAVANGERQLLVAAIASQVRFMKSWRTAAPPVNNVVQFPAAQSEHKDLSDDAMEQLTEVMRKAGIAEPRKGARGPEYEVRFYGEASAGEGIELFEDVPAEFRQIPQHYWRKGARGVLKAVGDSMIDVGIFPNDIMFIKPTPQPHTGDLVICRVNRKVFVKELRRNERGEPAKLVSKNEKYGPIEIPADAEIEFYGVVVGRTGDL